MKKKLLSLVLCTAMTAALLSGCGSSETTPADASAEAPADTAADTAEAAPASSAGEEDNVIKIGV